MGGRGERQGPRAPWNEGTAKEPERAGVGPQLVVIWAEQSRSVELPPQGRFLLGRAEDADVFIDHASLSRRHAAVVVGREGMTVEDLGSANGTRLDGAKLVPNVATPLRAGAVLEMAGVLVVVRAGGAADRDAARAASQVELDAPMREVLEHLDIAARSTLSVILLGETGVGKEVLANRVHHRSLRAKGPFLKINCATLVESLLEAELFGAERGAFTGAVQSKEGLLEAASSGTIFLDEVGELPLPTQAKLLRVLESGEVTRVGGIKPRAVDVRFVCATNRNLAHEVSTGAFRQDLYFRLDGVSVLVPPLRERPSEMVPLAQTFADEACAEASRPPLIVGRSAAVRLTRHAWPGNVRELRNVIRRSVVFCRSAALEEPDLRFEGIGGAGSVPPPRPAPSAPSVSSTSTGTLPPLLAPSKRRRLEAEHDREHILLALERCGGNQTRAAQLLGISRRTLVTRLGDLNLPRPRKGKGDDE